MCNVVKRVDLLLENFESKIFDFWCKMIPFQCKVIKYGMKLVFLGGKILHICDAIKQNESEVEKCGF